MEYKDYYQILGVAKSADEKRIKQAYRRLAREYHPDKNPGDKSAEEKFKEINEAYEVLGNSQNRTKYDQLGSNYHRFRQMGGNPGDFDFSQWFSGAGASGSYQRVNVDLGDLFAGGGGFSDFFRAIFGSGRGPAAYSQSMGRENMFAGAAANSLDVEQRIEISLEDAFTGVARKLRQGDGSKFEARIPSGVKTGTKVRLRGKGQRGPYGTGDLFLLVEVMPHEVFKRSGNNLRVEVAVDVVTAVLGGQVEVPTLTGPVNLTIPAGTQGGQTFRLRGKGMPLLRHPQQFGDLLATVRIRIPQKLNARERQLYEKLADRP